MSGPSTVSRREFVRTVGTCSVAAGGLLGGKLTAVSANHRDRALGSYTLLAAVYPDPPAARSALQHVVSNLDRYLKVVEKGPSRLVFKDYENKYGTVSVTGARLDLRLHLQRASGS